MSDALKPCPFCGGEAERVDLEDEGDGENFGGSVIQCTRCQASTAVHFDRKENLYSSWNDRRALPSDFTSDDFRAVLDPLVSGDDATIRAGLSNNLNVIVAALRIAAASPADVVGEIVAWRVKDSADGWILTHSKAEAEYQSREMSGATIEPLWRRFSTGGGWNRNMDEAPRGVKLLAGWRNDLGKWRSVTARYYPALTLVAGDDCDADDEGYAPEGWHEESETHETLHPINPTAWRHLPPAPGETDEA